MSLQQKILTAAVALGLGLGLGGCTPSPEQTCDRLQELSDKDSSSKGKFSKDKCVKNLTELKERSADDYKCAAKTVKALNSYDTALLAIMVCDKEGGKKKKDK